MSALPGSSLTHDARVTLDAAHADGSFQAGLGQFAQLLRAGRMWDALALGQSMSASEQARTALAEPIAELLGSMGLTAPAGLLLGRPASSDREITPETRRTILERNLSALLGSGSISADDAEAIARAARTVIEQERSFEANDSNIVHVPGETPSDITTWGGVMDAAGLAASSIARLPASEGVTPQPIVVMGCESLWLVRALWRRCVTAERQFPLFNRRIIVVEPDVLSVARGLSTCDLARAFSERRWWWFVGENAIHRLTNTLNDHLEQALPVRSIASAAIPSIQKDQQQFQGVMQRLLAEQSQRKQDARGRAREAYLGRDASYWAPRFEEAAADNRPLRVLISTTRHSTFLRHSADDLAAAFRAIGHDVRVLMEPDASTIFTDWALTRSVVEHEPDMVVTINYPRGSLASFIPPELPVVCWIQDAMPHLLSPDIAQKQGPHDLLAGYCMRRMFDDGIGYDVRRTLYRPVPANEHKFTCSGREEPAAPAQHIVFVSHHGESPEAMRDRLATQVTDGDRGLRLVHSLYEQAQSLSSSAVRVPIKGVLGRCIEAVFADIYNKSPGPTIQDQLRVQILEPLVGRFFRHQAVEWAGAIAKRRGWTFALYGNGWRESRFAEFARGPLDHDESLRKVYTESALTLHLDPFNAVHQRVSECVLSGGLPAVRFSLEMLSRAAADESAGRTDDAQQARVAAIRRTLGVEDSSWNALVEKTDDPPGSIVTDYEPFDPIRMLEPFEKIAFTDEATLEALLDRAITDAAWRREASSSIRARVLEHATNEAFARGTVDRLARVLREDAAQ